MMTPVKFIVDFEGDDNYFGHDYALGGGVFGANILLDLAGNDKYIAGNFSLGSGLFGVGILRDFAGSDIYSGGQCSQGSGAFGFGFLIDENGHDLYNCHMKSQGFGFTMGFGCLLDIKGSDSYTSNSTFCHTESSIGTIIGALSSIGAGLPEITFLFEILGFEAILFLLAIVLFSFFKFRSFFSSKYIISP